MNQNITPLRTAGILLGIGLGGFVDGILLHQVLQVHNMLSAQYFPDNLVNEQINMFWDGLFHVFTWIVTAIGLWKLWRVAQLEKSPLQSNIFIGSMILGWGLFNLIEGIIDHQILGLHNVVQRAAPGPQFFWDMLFLAVGGLGFIAIGAWQIKVGRRKLATDYEIRDFIHADRMAS
jgi:uncharacterized membrane protein